MTDNVGRMRFAHRAGREPSPKPVSALTGDHRLSHAEAVRLALSKALNLELTLASEREWASITFRGSRLVFTSPVELPPLPGLAGADVSVEGALIADIAQADGRTIEVLTVETDNTRWLKEAARQLREQGE